MSTDEELYGPGGVSKPNFQPSHPAASTPVQSEYPVQVHGALSILPREGSSQTSISGAHKRSRSPITGIKECVKKIEERTLSPPHKRRRLERRPLYSLIPEPHLYTVPIPLMSTEFSPPTLPEEQQNSKTYTTLNTLEILPSSCYTNQTLDTLFKDPYSRSAWVIPVRGIPPFSHCTAASILDTDVDADNSTSQPNTALLPSGPLSNDAHQDSPGSITWTPDALRSFWNFLIAVREAGNTGPIALSFHCTNPYIPSASSTTGRAFGQNRSTVPGSNGKSSTGKRSTSELKSKSASLRDLDYFKVYVDAPYVSKMRDVLHVWRYEYLLPTQLGGEVTRTRLLRGAKFVLVDERNKGVLVW
ncbi:hypothetical protein BDY19DRAFT_883104 [Irpex rosettiformis]|uniref:Uncharacterized protein n=1 Tax=Irpex rosettiformis TaxID=378272 RepID=A0ACB8UFB1_9APHY|nr:hypothetical protein BDY19DRAFT_883104 [Irpex rosettiformis]